MPFRAPTYPRFCHCPTLRKLASAHSLSHTAAPGAVNGRMRVHADGLTMLAPGKLAAMVTFLVHDLGPGGTSTPLPDGYFLDRLSGADLVRYREIYRRVGAEWLWFSRLRMSDEALWEILASREVEALVLAGPQGEAGLLELDFRDKAAPELAFFGLVPEAVGAGLGRALMDEALQRARAAGAKALHVHTCTLDHPKALSFYCRAGFRPVRRAVEVFNDPRLDGTLPRETAGWMPILET